MRRSIIDHCGCGARAKRAHPLYIHTYEKVKRNPNISMRFVYYKQAVSTAFCYLKKAVFWDVAPCRKYVN
jgi:hypothetical protein